MSDKKNIGFLDDDNGNPSAMRLMSFISLGYAGFAGFMTLINNSEHGNFLTLSFLIGAFAPKSFQKIVEIRK